MPRKFYEYHASVRPPAKPHRKRFIGIGNFSERSFRRLLMMVAILKLMCGELIGAELNSCRPAAECLSLKGTLVMKRTFPKERFSRQRFEAITDGVQWKARLTSLETNDPTLYFEYGMDGESVYKVAAFNTNYSGPITSIAKDGTVQERIGFGGPVVGNGFANLSPVPINGDLMIVSLWSAFFSGCYLSESDEAGRSELPALYLVPFSGYGEDAPLVAKASWSLSSSFPRFPTSIVLTDGPYFKYSQIDGKTKAVPFTTKPGKTNLVFRATGRIQERDWAVPATFEMTSYSFQESIISGNVVGTVEMVQIANKPTDFLPKFPGKTQVYDNRVSEDKSTVYTTSNKWIDAAQLRQEKPKAVNQARRISGPKGGGPEK